MRALFFLPEFYLQAGIANGVSLLSAILKEHGHEVALFDTSFLRTRRSDITAEVRVFLEKMFKSGFSRKENDYLPDGAIEAVFLKEIQEFKPNVIAMSTTTDNFYLGRDILQAVKPEIDKNILIVSGGVHSTILPEEIIAEDVIDVVCVGEGEEALLELCNMLQQGKDYSNIKNLWTKTKRNPLRNLIDLDTLPTPDWTIFDKRHFPRGFMGKTYIGGNYLSARGCPFRCAYCVNNYLFDLQRSSGRFFRSNSVDTTIRHLSELKEKHGLQIIKFNDDNFVSNSERYLMEFAEKYVDKVNLPFMISASPTLTTAKKIEILKKAGLVAVSMGIETGNEWIRKNVLKRKVSNDDVLKAFSLLKEFDIRASSFNMIGLPTETRANVFETIELNRQCNVASTNVYFLRPFPKTEIIKYCKRKVPHNISVLEMSELEISEIPAKELRGLQRTFNLYVKLPKDMWPEIKLAETYDDKYIKLLDYQQKYFT